MLQKCELCPQKDGALKRTDMGGWCHVVCALFIPEAWFGNVQTMEPIILKGVPPERFNKVVFQYFYHVILVNFKKVTNTIIRLISVSNASF